MLSLIRMVVGKSKKVELKELLFGLVHKLKDSNAHEQSLSVRA
ncbi:hypothetical protein KL86DES1_21133 [uncultured Desulfovibrio sp.]|jgi:hypothetical protein|uniref:Uncharacterized protein n=1 Tax=uncultured Desulfovibrio sp. TaxID=167968 RepID=A0A212L6U4_9BACT|nr:hypothetical protein KL86DES1_21133 [uncultured Desulfovibrio sp.]VZH34030.1 conserved protein of unknown function [Desulfovibrio sp. 86]